MPKPTSKLKSYPAKHPVTAITPYPFLERAEFANKSPKEFPQARNVSPRKSYLSPLIRAKSSRKFIRMLQMILIHKIDMKNPNIPIVKSYFGNFFLWLVKKTIMKRIMLRKTNG